MNSSRPQAVAHRRWANANPEHEPNQVDVKRDGLKVRGVALVAFIGDAFNQPEGETSTARIPRAEDSIRGRSHGSSPRGGCTTTRSPAVNAQRVSGYCGCPFNSSGAVSDESCTTPTGSLGLSSAYPRPAMSVGVTCARVVGARGDGSLGPASNGEDGQLPGGGTRTTFHGISALRHSHQHGLPLTGLSPIVPPSDGRRRLSSSVRSLKSSEVRAIASAARRNSGSPGVE